jgi:transcriptional regulator with XRE-family HTH domain
MKTWEKKVLREPGAARRVAEIEDELRLATGLTALREQADLSQRELAVLLGVSQPRVAKIERSRNVTVDVLEQYVRALGGSLEISVRKGNRRIALLSAGAAPRKAAVKKAGSSKRVVKRAPVRVAARAAAGRTTKKVSV